MTFTQKVALAGEYVMQTVRHPTKRTIMYFLAIVWINAINFYLFHHRLQVLSHFTSSLSEVAPLNNYKGHAIPRKLIDNIVFKMWGKIGNVGNDTRRMDTHLGNYDDFFAVHDVSSIVGLSYSERCDAYFRSLYAKSKQWHLDSANEFFIDMEFQMDWEDYKKKYINWAVEMVAKEKKIPELEVDKNGNDVKDKIAKAFDNLKLKAKQDEYTMRDFVAHARIFNRCYVERENGDVFHSQDQFLQKQQSEMRSLATNFQLTTEEEYLSSDAFDLCGHLQSKMFPWMQNSFPSYQRHTGEIVRSPPHMNKYVSDRHVNAPSDSHYSSAKGAKSPVHSKLTNNKQCWINEFKNRISGKGIVIPFEASSIDDTVNLIHLLRALGNRYPVQIVYYTTMSKEHKEKLVDAARRPFTDMPRSFSKVHDLIPKLSFEAKTNGFLATELWFVDASTMVAGHFQSKLSKVPIIAWASVVNSFEEYILMLPLAAPLKDPQYFFDLEGYKQKGAYFYRAKAWKKRDSRDLKFFNRMAPSLVDATMFDIPVLSSEVLDIPFFDSLSEVQDAGLSVINRARHFSSVMMQLQLAQFFPANHRSNNGLEIWLAFALNGDLDFHFHDLLPAAMGKFTEPALRLKDGSKKPDSKEICGSQVGHLDFTHSAPTPAWISGGFQGCSSRKIEFPKELSSKVFPWRHIIEEADLKSFYNDRIQLENAIVPPFEGVDLLELKNDEKEPTKPWQQHQGCDAKFFCGYSRIGGKNKDKDTTKYGRVVDFDRASVDLFDFYGDIWVGTD